jgi:hypothetical protein
MTLRPIVSPGNMIFLMRHGAFFDAARFPLALMICSEL